MIANWQSVKGLDKELYTPFVNSHRKTIAISFVIGEVTGYSAFSNNDEFTFWTV